VLEDFAKRAYRRPVDDSTLEKLVSIAKNTYSLPGKSFEAGIAQAMAAILASPRFLFRVEDTGIKQSGETFSYVDEYALASRLSYFLWSTMPDEELFRLAKRGELRENLESQVKRMFEDSRSDVLVKNFTGQWLQARDIEIVPIDARRVLELPRRRRGGRNIEFSRDVRRAMRQETEMVFDYIMREDRSILELIDSDYTFLNEPLAKHYNIKGVHGKEMRRVELPKDSPRGGILTQGTVLAVTSNPTRTSPVKRGLFVLENILGTPAPPAPPDVPELEEAQRKFKDREPTVREIMELHRSAPLCSSCHARFDPLGMAFENFNAMGMWRDTERNQEIDASGELITGETLNGIQDLKEILTGNYKLDFYRCLTEKMLIYAIGRGLDYYDEYTVDQIVEQLDQKNGRFSALLMGIIESAPFQKQRSLSDETDRPSNKLSFSKGAKP